jgi:hypothetical protein
MTNARRAYSVSSRVARQVSADRAERGDDEKGGGAPSGLIEFTPAILVANGFFSYPWAHAIGSDEISWGCSLLQNQDWLGIRPAPRSQNSDRPYATDMWLLHACSR